MVCVQAVFQVVTLPGTNQHLSFVKQLYPLAHADAQVPTVRVPDQASLHFVVTLSGVEEGECLVFEERWSGGGEVEVKRSREWMSIGVDNDTGTAYAYHTIPTLCADATRSASVVSLSVVNQTNHTIVFQVQVPFTQCQLRPRVFDDASGQVSEFGVLMEVQSAGFSWLSVTGGVMDLYEDSDSDSEGEEATVVEQEIIVDPIKVDPVQVQVPVVTVSSAPIALEPITTNATTNTDDFDVLEESAPLSTTPESLPSSPPPSDQTINQTVNQSVNQTINQTAKTSPSSSLMQQVGSLLIGSRVGQMVVTAGASAVSVSEFDAARIKSKYTCSPLYMLGVEYRMFVGENSGNSNSGGVGETISLLPTIVSTDSSTVDILRVSITANPYRHLLSRAELVCGVRRVFVVIGGAAVQPQALSDGEWSVECHLERLQHQQLGPVVLVDGRVKYTGQSRSEKEAAMACRKLLRFIDNHFGRLKCELVLHQVYGLPQLPPYFTQIPASITAHVIPLSRHYQKTWRRMGGQVYVWVASIGTSTVQEWTLADLKVTNNNCLSLLVTDSISINLVLSKCRLARSGDGSCRLALLHDSVTMMRTLNRDDYDLLVHILDSSCRHTDPVSSGGNMDQKWVELNSGIINEFIYDFQSRFWFTYRRHFDRLSQDTLLTTDAGWGCMVRVGQSMVAEAMARTVLGREWRVGELRESADALANYVDIVSLFLDTPSSVLSVHRIALEGAEYGLPLGHWFGPTVLARAIKYVYIFVCIDHIV